MQRKQYVAYQRPRNFAYLVPPQRTKLLVCPKANPKKVDLIPGFEEPARPRPLVPSPTVTTTP